jgi:hypothetical protein
MILNSINYSCVLNIFSQAGKTLFIFEVPKKRKARTKLVTNGKESCEFEASTEIILVWIPKENGGTPFKSSRQTRSFHEGLVM